MFYPSATVRVMIDVARKISSMIMRDYYELQLLQTSRKSLDSFYDHLVKRVLKKIEDDLTKARPEFLYDLTNNAQGDFWVFNVLEGKHNFLHAVPNFAISIAHVRKKNTFKEVVSGLIVLPFFKEAYYAELGKGAWLEQFDMQKDRADILRVSGRCEKQDLLLATNDPKFSGEGVRNFGSVGLSLAYLASGRVDAVVLEGIKYQDIAAGLLIARQAGAAVYEQDTKVLAFTEYAKTQYNL
jgi:myo-inositol-1(or 4)-monophosphatase